MFGRVAPQQKRAIVQALQSRGHVVAMTGDGVNDALALKDADIGVAMGNGAAATRAVAQLVLLDGQFGAMPGVVAEGRRVIANVERVANLYITKTVYAVVFAVVVGVAAWTYPFVPRHMTVVSSLTIGIPSFFLALAPSNRRYEPGFVHRVARFTIPAGLTLGIATLATYGIVRRIDHVTEIEASSVAIVVLVALGLWVLLVLARPLTPLRVLLVALMALSFVVLLLSPTLRNFYEIHLTHETSSVAHRGNCDGRGRARRGADRAVCAGRASCAARLRGCWWWSRRSWLMRPAWCSWARWSWRCRGRRA